jgi:excisionase family DNA binding protein
MTTMTDEPTRGSNSPTDPVYLTVAEVGRRLSLGRTTVWKLISDGELETVRLSERAVRVPVASVEAYVARQLERERERRGW